ncbi:hypothetical protein THAOC_14279, partial [Thalassiosira oceanica]
MVGTLLQWARANASSVPLSQSCAQIHAGSAIAADADARREVFVNGNGGRPEVCLLLGADSGGPVGPQVRYVFGPTSIVASVRRGVTPYDGQTLGYTDPYWVGGSPMYSMIELPQNFAETETLAVTRLPFADQHFGTPDAKRIDRANITAGANEVGQLEVGRVCPVGLETILVLSEKSVWGARELYSRLLAVQVADPGLAADVPFQETLRWLLALCTPADGQAVSAIAYPQLTEVVPRPPLGEELFSALLTSFPGLRVGGAGGGAGAGPAAGGAAGGGGGGGGAGGGAAPAPVPTPHQKLAKRFTEDDPFLAALVLEMHGFPAGSSAEALPYDVLVFHTRSSSRRRHTAMAGMARSVAGRYVIIESEQAVTPPQIIDSLLKGEIIPLGEADIAGGFLPIAFFGSPEAQTKLKAELARLHDLQEGSILQFSTDEDASKARIRAILRMTTYYPAIKVAVARWSDHAAGYFGEVHRIAVEAHRVYVFLSSNEVVLAGSFARSPDLFLRVMQDLRLRLQKYVRRLRGGNPAPSLDLVAPFEAVVDARYHKLPAEVPAPLRALLDSVPPP